MPRLAPSCLPPAPCLHPADSPSPPVLPQCCSLPLNSGRRPGRPLPLPPSVCRRPCHNTRPNVIQVSAVPISLLFDHDVEILFMIVVELATAGGLLGLGGKGLRVGNGAGDGNDVVGADDAARRVWQLRVGAGGSAVCAWRRIIQQGMVCLLPLHRFLAALPDLASSMRVDWATLKVETMEASCRPISPSCWRAASSIWADAWPGAVMPTMALLTSGVPPLDAETMALGCGATWWCPKWVAVLSLGERSLGRGERPLLPRVSWRRSGDCDRRSSLRRWSVERLSRLVARGRKGRVS